jgi:hypothetical protein
LGIILKNRFKQIRTHQQNESEKQPPLSRKTREDSGQLKRNILISFFLVALNFTQQQSDQK